ncbi:MAG: hypothetical protein ACC700_18695 [Anaerolineales bacterium]
MTSKLRFEYDFNGYPADFAAAIRDIERDFRAEYGRSVVGSVEDIEKGLDADLWIVTGWFIPIEGTIAKGTITVEMDLEGFQGFEHTGMGEAHSILTVTVPKEDSNLLWPTWEKIGQELGLHGLEGSESVTPQSSMKENPPGNHVPTERKFDFAKARKKQKQRGPWAGTLHKIERLSEIRRNSKRERGSIPTRISACDTVNIDPRTVRKYAAELWEKWDDMEY